MGRAHSYSQLHIWYKDSHHKSDLKNIMKKNRWNFSSIFLIFLDFLKKDKLLLHEYLNQSPLLSSFPQQKAAGPIVFNILWLFSFSCKIKMFRKWSHWFSKWFLSPTNQCWNNVSAMLGKHLAMMLWFKWDFKTGSCCRSETLQRN